jgi:Holliday junction DNA helicase RuvB
MEEIIIRSARILNVDIDDGVAAYLSCCCRSTPRIANRLVRSIRDFAQVKSESAISLKRVKETLLSLGIDTNGLDETDRQILSSIVQKFGGGPVGLSTIAASIAEERETVEDVYEPFLLQSGYLQRTAKGRMATPLTYDLFGMEMPQSLQSSLFS